MASLGAVAGHPMISLLRRLPFHMMPYGMEYPFGQFGCCGSVPSQLPVLPSPLAGRAAGEAERKKNILSGVLPVS